MAEGWSGKPGRQQTFPRPTGNMSPPSIPTSNGGQKFFQIHARSDGEEIMDFFKQVTAVVIADPQNDFLSPDGVTWWLVGAVSKKMGRYSTSTTYSAPQSRRDTMFSSRPIITSPRTKAGSSVERLKR